MSSRSPLGAFAHSPTAAATRCRYKTGRCGNARVVKPNGSLLLLCEFHRDQQNRTKKRSDMKYRHHRAKKRQLDKHSPRGDGGHARQRDTFTPTSTSASASVPCALGHRRVWAVPDTPSSVRPEATPTPMTTTGTATAPSHALRSPVVSSLTMLSSSSGGGRLPLHAPGAVLTRRESTSIASLKKAALYRLSSGLRAAATSGGRISPGKVRMDALRTRETFAASRRDIVAMASPANKPTSLANANANAGPAIGVRILTSAPLLSPLVFPLCLSPLQLDSPWVTRGAWQPEDVRLLEYFIL